MTVTLADLAELERRLMEASEPSRELDLAVGKALDGIEPRAVIITAGDYCGAVGYTDRNQWAVVNLKPYTTSLDAAVGLAERVLPRWHWHVETIAKPHTQWLAEMYDCEAYRPGGAKQGYSKATPAVALLIAIIRALKEQANG